jgi:hypothetical protein
MADSFRKVRPGEPLAIPAAAYNAFVDAARESQARRLGQEQGSQQASRQTGIVFVRNDSGEDRERFDILGIETPIFTPTDDEDAFKNQVALKGIIPTAVDHTGKFVILLEPIAAGEVGRACIAGVCPAWLYIADEGHTFADVYDGDATMLRSAPTGSAQVIWKEEGTGPLWAVVRIGNQVTAAFPAKLTAEDTPGEYGWEEQGLDANGDFIDLDEPRFGDGSGGEGDLGLAREFNDAEGLYTESPTVYVHMFEFTDQGGGKRYRFTCGQPVIRWGVLASDWDVNGCPNYVTVNPCDKGGGNPDPAVEVKVYIGWPDSGHLAPYFWNLRAGSVIPYVPIGSAGDGTPEGTAFRLWSNPVWGKVIDDWQENQNFVMVRLTDEDGLEIGYAANVKCWLYSPENLANVKGVKLKAGDLIRVELPTYDPGTGVSFAHAINIYGGSGKNELLDGANHTDTADADPAVGDLISAWGDPVKWNRVPVGAAQSLLYVDPGPPIMPGWLPKGGEQSLLYINAGLLDWFNPGLAQSMLITGAGGNLAWKPRGLNESVYITRNGQLDWLGPGNWDSILYNNAGSLDWLNPPWPPALLMYDALGLAWLPPGANEELLVSRNNTFAWLAKGAEQALLYVDNGLLDWFNPGLPQSMLITGQQGLAWKPRGLDESIYITRNQQLDWLGPGGWDSILYNNAGTLDWLNPGLPPALLMYDWLGLAWFGPGANEDLLITRNWTFDWLAKGAEQAILYVNNGQLDWFNPGLAESMLIVGQQGLAWKPRGLDESIYITRNQQLDWLAKGDDPSILVTDGGTVQWSHGADTTGRGAVLWIDPNGVFGWGQSYHALLDDKWHYDTADALPTKGAMIYMTADPPNGLWDVLNIGADQSFLHVNNGIPEWKAKGDDGSLLTTSGGLLSWLAPSPDAGRPLLYQANGPEWFDGPTATLTFVTDVRVDGVNFQKKSRQIEVTKGVICQIGAESDWETFHTGTECPE